MKESIWRATIAAFATLAITVGCGDADETELSEADPTVDPAAEMTGATEVPDSVVELIPESTEETIHRSERGEATFYADQLDRQRTASGELMDQSAMVAAHRDFPFGTRLRVKNLRNDRTVEVRVIDRGPFGRGARGQRAILDLSRAAAERLNFISAGRALVQVEVMEWGSGATI